MKKWVGPICLAVGSAFLIWFTLGYISLAFLTKQWIEDMSIILLFQGYLYALWSWPGIMGILLTAIGAILVRDQLRRLP